VIFGKPTPFNNSARWIFLLVRERAVDTNLTLWSSCGIGIVTQSLRDYMSTGNDVLWRKQTTNAP
jgi:hypothetical protein